MQSRQQSGAGTGSGSRPCRRTGLACLARAASVVVAALAPLFSSGTAAQEQSWPVRPVKLIVPFGAGGPADIYARTMAQGLAARLGQPFVVEDRPGAGSVAGTDAAAHAAPDGYTLVMISNTQAINETLYPKLPYRLLRDFTPVTQVNTMPNVLVVHPGLAAGTVPALIALARARPGQLNYASSGSGTPYHLAAELFKTMAGVSITHVPYRASGDARTAVVAGQVDLMFDSLPTALPQVQSGKLRALAITSPARSALLPDLPTVAESGLAGFEADLWLGIEAPAGTPEVIVSRLRAAAAGFLQQPETRQRFAEQGTIAVGSEPAVFAAFLRQEVEKWGKVVRFSGARVD